MLGPRASRPPNFSPNIEMVQRKLPFLRQISKRLVGLLTSAVGVLVHTLQITTRCNSIGMTQAARDFFYRYLAVFVEERGIR
jgi:hypothetical protein